MVSSTVLKWVASFNPLPAPLTPEAASTLIVSGSIRAIRGLSARIAEVGSSPLAASADRGDRRPLQFRNA